MSNHELDRCEAGYRRGGGATRFQLLRGEPTLHHAGESATDRATAAWTRFFRGCLCERDGRENAGNRPGGGARPSAIEWRRASCVGTPVGAHAARDKGSAG